MRAFLSVLFVCVLLGTVPAVATMPDKPTSPEEGYPDIESIPKPLLAGLQHLPLYESQYVSHFLSIFHENDQSRQSLSQVDIDNYSKKREFEHRREQYLSLIDYDSDFDGKITQLEVNQEMLEDRRLNHRGEEGCADEASHLVARYDADKDGIISLNEMSALSGFEKTRRESSALIMKTLLALDPDHDGKLTLEEAASLARKAFSTADSDHDRKISDEEFENISAVYSVDSLFQ